MKYKILFITVLCLITTSLPAKKQKGEKLKYDIENVGQEAAQHTYLIMAWVYVSKPKVSVDLIKEAAVRGIIFKGYTGSQGIQSQNPLVKNPAIEEEKAEFFETFFAQGGDYLKYATVLDNSYEVIKLSKKEYKVGMVVSVAKDNLRKTLEDAGIIRGLSSGF